MALLWNFALQECIWLPSEDCWKTDSTGELSATCIEQVMASVGHKLTCKNMNIDLVAQLEFVEEERR
jgi:hypothetical protein